MESDLESKINQLLAPYLQKITQLEEDSKKKDIEITTLKHAIYDLSKLLDSKPKLGGQKESNKGTPQLQNSKSQVISNNRPQTQQSVQQPKKQKEEGQTNEQSQKGAEFSEKQQKKAAQKQQKKQNVEKGGEGSIKADFGRSHQWVFPPTNYVTQELQIPQANLEAYKVIGYNGKNGRHNLYFINETKVVYCTACVVVILDLQTLEQQILQGHNNDILCLAYNPINQVIATGQIDPKGEEGPFICLWDIQGNLIKKLFFHKNSVVALAFSSDGKTLASVGGDNDHTFAVWKWEKKDKPESSQPNEKNNIYGLIGLSENSWAQFGEKHVRILVFDKNQIQVQKVIFGTKDIPKACVCGVQVNKQVWVGTDEGKLLIFEDRTCTKTIKAHEGGLTAIQKYKDAQDQLQIVTIGIDGQVMVWNENQEKISSNSFIKEEMTNFLQGVTVRPKAMDILSNGQIIIGTSTNLLIKSDIQGNSQILLASHFNNANFVAVHPSEPKFASVGHDKLLRIINIQEQNYQGNLKVLEDKANTVQYSLDGQHIAVGFEDGNLRVYNTSDLSVAFQQKIGKHSIVHIKYSPDNQLLAVASGPDIRLLKASEGYQEAFKLTGAVGHTKMVTFSKDSQILFANTNNYELLYWQTSTGERIDFHNSVRDVEWASMNNINSWHVRGIWDASYDGTDVNFCSVNMDENYLAIGDDFGKVKLFTYPSGEPAAPFKSFHGHSEHVTCVQWSQDQQYLISSGGSDNTIIIWKLEEKTEI